MFSRATMEAHNSGNKRAEEIMDLQLELDIFKIILKEERTSRGELEERIICLNKDLELATEKLYQLPKDAKMLPVN